MLTLRNLSLAVLSLSLCAIAPAAPKTGPVTSDQALVDALDDTLPGMDALKAAIDRHDLAATKAALQAYRRTVSQARWEPNPFAWKPRPPVLPASTDPTLDPLGEEICRHIIYNPYNYGPRKADMGKNFDWLTNPTPPDDPSFTKEFTWTAVSRMAFWGDLADAYAKTKNEKYAREWVWQLRDFAADNPVEITAPSSKTMLWRSLDMGRIKGPWAKAYFQFLNTDAFDADAHWLFYKLVYEHALRFDYVLRDQKGSGNWVTSEAGSLYAIGVLFPEFKEAKAWTQKGMDRLIRELDRAVPDDGFQAELSPLYHVTTLHSFTGVQHLALLNNDTLPEAFSGKIIAMYKVLVRLMDQAGFAPPINDSARENAIKLAREGIQLGDDPVLRWAVSGGEDGEAPALSDFLPYAGLHILRGGWATDDLYLLFDGGPPGIGHQHEDKLNVILQAFGKRLLLDPGTYSYDQSRWRYYVLGTPAHNTLTVDGKWQHRGANKPPILRNTTNIWAHTPLFDFASSVYDDGYETASYAPIRYQPIRWEGDKDRSVTHRRHVFYLRPWTVLVLDSLEGGGRHTFDAYFNTDAIKIGAALPNQSLVGDYGDGVHLSIVPLDRENLKVDVKEGSEEPMLGWLPTEKLRAIPTVRHEKTQNAPARFATLLYPHRDSDSSPAIDRDGALPAHGSNLASTGAEGFGYTLHTPDGASEVWIARDGHNPSPAKEAGPAASFESTLLGGSVSTKAGGVFVNHSQAEGALTLGGWEITHLAHSSDWALATQSPATLLIELDKQTQAPRTCFNGSDEPVTLFLKQEGTTKESTLPPHEWTTL